MIRGVVVRLSGGEAERWGVELVAATSWCQNCPAEGQNRDSNSTCAFRDGDLGDLGDGELGPFELAGGERSKNCHFEKTRGSVV